MKKILSVVARAFTHKTSTKGGNPVTVFLLPPVNPAPTPSIRSALAQKCDWESVIVHFSESSSNSVNLQYGDLGTGKPTLYFYMPSGEQVSYCAHAAMGASYVISEKQQQGADAAIATASAIDFITAGGEENTAYIRAGQEVELGIQNDLQEKKVDPSVIQSLLEQIGLKMDDVVADDAAKGITASQQLPLLNSSVARYKTLIPIKSLERLHNASNPKDADDFRILCDSVDSTGVYIYSRASVNDGEAKEERDGKEDDLGLTMKIPSFECRQFPRASGYPEDPATGIAAAALVSSLARCGFAQDDTYEDSKKFSIYQGTAMGKKSKLNVRLDADMVYCSGTVEIDSEECISLDDL